MGSAERKGERTRVHPFHATRAFRSSLPPFFPFPYFFFLSLVFFLPLFAFEASIKRVNGKYGGTSKVVNQILIQEPWKGIESTFEGTFLVRENVEGRHGKDNFAISELEFFSESLPYTEWHLIKQRQMVTFNRERHPCSPSSSFVAIPFRSRTLRGKPYISYIDVRGSSEFYFPLRKLGKTV